MGIPVKLDVFEGPLDLLLHLIDKHKVDIYDIPIVMITEQYMEYIRKIDKKDLDVMSEFLVMAATLVKIKSKMLLPKEEIIEEEEDPRQELVEKLLEYKMYKYMSVALKDRQIDAGKVLYKKATIPKEIADYKEEIHPAELVKDLSLAKMHYIFQSLMKKRVDRIDPIRSRFGKIEKEEITVADKMVYIKQYAKEQKRFRFRSLLEEQSSKVEIIVTFLGILELMKMGILKIVQEHIFDDISISYIRKETEQME